MTEKSDTLILKSGSNSNTYVAEVWAAKDWVVLDYADSKHKVYSDLEPDAALALGCELIAAAQKVKGF